MKMNSVDPAKEGPAVRDGIEELWIDGELTIRNPRVRFRRAPHLKITFFSLETEYHGLPVDFDREHPVQMSVANLVIAKKYIGPMVTVHGSGSGSFFGPLRPSYRSDAVAPKCA